MANALQQQSVRRKLAYIGVIVGLFTLTWLYRFNVVEARATELALREEARGDVELGGSAVRLSLTGSRGVVICYLWMEAMERQKKNQWNELELIVQSLTKLQPHFITPWRFQSWNLAYNVSVEADRVRDKYYYIARGMQMLAEGERQNRYNPELRYDLGFYYQQKLGQHDEKEKLIALFQLSCVDPIELNRLRDAMARTKEKLDRPEEELRNQTAFLEEFRAFSRKHPQLVRRLREKVVDVESNRKKHETPADVARYLEDNRDVPSLFVTTRSAELGETEQTPLKPVKDRFPILPPRQLYDPDELTPDSTLGDNFLVFDAARTWFGYAQDPLPEPAAMPGETKEPSDRVRQRKPKGMWTIIFRNAPMRSQNYVAERIEDDGWFGEDWNLLRAFPQLKALGTRDMDVRADPKEGSLAREQWAKAEKMWRRNGRDNHLLVEDLDQLERLKSAQQKMISHFNGQIDPRTTSMRPEELPPDLRDAYEATAFMQAYDTCRMQTNFPHFLMRSHIEQESAALNGRKYFFQAAEPRLRPDREARIQKYEAGLLLWRELFARYPDLRQDELFSEDMAELQFKYLALFQELPRKGQQIKKAMVVQDMLGLLAASPGMSVEPWLCLGELENLQLVPPPRINGPFEVTDEQGHPYLKVGSEETVASRMGALAKLSGRSPRTMKMPEGMTMEMMKRGMKPPGMGGAPILQGSGPVAPESIPGMGAGGFTPPGGGAAPVRP